MFFLFQNYYFFGCSCDSRENSEISGDSLLRNHSLISQKREREQKHMITAGKLHPLKVYWHHALGEYLYSC